MDITVQACRLGVPGHGLVFIRHGYHCLSISIKAFSASIKAFSVSIRVFSVLISALIAILGCSKPTDRRDLHSITVLIL